MLEATVSGLITNFKSKKNMGSVDFNLELNLGHIKNLQNMQG